jgi:putative PEP-CTERM system TPR-repeat lipoprotein
MTVQHTAVRGFLLALVVAVVAACAETPEALITSAKEYLGKGDAKAAVIQLKNALQKNPDIAEARFLLGRALLDTRDILAAEKELRRALELKYPSDEVVPPLVHAMVAGGQYKSAIDEFGSASVASPKGVAELQASLAQAYFATGDAAKGKAAIESALAAQPDYPPAVLGAARLKAANGDAAGALAAIDAALDRNPKLIEAWLFKGDLENAQGRPDGAVAAYRKALEVEPQYLAAHSALVVLLFGQGKAEEAAAQLATMKKIAPLHPQTLYLEAVLAYSRKDYATAAAALQKQLSAVPDNVPGTALSGAVNYHLGSYATSEAELSKVLKMSPGHLFARRMLIANYLKTGKPDRALQALLPVLPAVDKDPALSALAGEVYLRNGQPAEAARYFTKNVALDPQSSSARVGLAVSHIAAGQHDMAFRELETAAAETPGTQADLVLIRTAIARKEFDKALTAIDALERKQPNSPVASNLRGLALLGKRDVAGARKSFERAAALDARYFPAAANLARLDLGDKKPEDAKKRFEAVLAKDPKNVAALLAIAELRAMEGGSPDEVAEMIGKAIVANPTDSAPRMALMSHWLRANKARNAVAAGRDALAAMPDRPEVLRALGRAQLADGNPSGALESYNRLVQLQPNSPAPLMHVAEAQVAAKDKEAALRTLRKALALKADMLEAQRGIVMLETEAGRTAQAVAMAKEVQKQRPKEPAGYVLEGDAYAYRKSWVEAATAYRAGLKQTESVELATKLHSALVAGGNAKEAEHFAASWTREHRKDAAFRFYLGQSALAKQDYAAAASEFRGVVDLQPNNATALNNLAWASAQIKDPKAIEYAEKANRLAPNQPAVMDTLAMILVEKGDTARAIQLLRDAIKLAPSTPALRLSLAKALIKADQKDAAKKELEELAKLGDKFKSQADVEQMLKGL